MNNNHKVLRIIRLEERKTQTKGLSRNFVSLFVKLFLSFLAATMVSFLFVTFTSLEFALISKTSFDASKGIMIIDILLLLALAFTLTLTLTILLFAFYKMGGIHEGWTLDRATEAEKIVFALWIFLVMFALCLALGLLIALFGSDFGSLVFSLSILSIPQIFVLFFVFFPSLAKAGKAYRSKVEELILKEDKDESTEKNTKCIKIIRLKERITQKEGLSPSFISFCLKILFFSLAVAVLTLLFCMFAPRFQYFDNSGWLVISFETLTFTLILTLMILSIAFYKVDGVDEGWTMDRATGMEKVVIVLWILSLGVGIYFVWTHLSQWMKFFDFLILLHTPLSAPLILITFIILFASIIKTAKAYRSRIEELIIPEDKNE